jgi:hypothetical protein
MLSAGYSAKLIKIKNVKKEKETYKCFGGTYFILHGKNQLPDISQV